MLLPKLPAPQRRALETALALSDSEGRIEESLVAFFLLNALQRLSDDSPTSCGGGATSSDFISPSLALLQYVLPRLDRAPIAVVLHGSWQDSFVVEPDRGAHLSSICAH